MIRKVNKIGKVVIEDLKVPRWSEKDDSKMKYIQALVAVTEPKIKATAGVEMQFDKDQTSKPLLDLKRSQRH